MKDEVRKNRELWNEITPIHLKSKLYDMESFRRGRCSLLPLEVEEVGDVTGASLLHLQCHFGQDTLSWARRGAKATGMDFSPPAIDAARALSKELKIDARFICSDLYELSEHLEEEFDIVFASAGVLCWLPDLPDWGRIIARHLRPGGFFYLREFHPFAYCLDDAEDLEEPRLRYPYFHEGTALRFAGGQDGDYADPEALVQSDSHEWPYALSKVIGALLDAGLALEFFHEFDWTSYRQFPFLEDRGDGLYRLPQLPGGFPLMFSLKARK